MLLYFIAREFRIVNNNKMIAMKITKPDSAGYVVPHLRVAFKKSVKPVTVKHLPILHTRKKEELPDNVSVSGNKNVPEFYQHHINPKRFEFF